MTSLLAFAPIVTGSLVSRGSPAATRQWPATAMCASAPASTPRFTRRAVIALLTSVAATTLGGNSSSAESMLENAVRKDVTTLVDCLRKSTEVREKLASSSKDLSEEEAIALARYVAVWLSPAVYAAEHAASSSIISGKEITPYAKVLPIHLGELSGERRARKREGCIRELDEYTETVRDILKIKELAPFVKGKRWNGTKWEDTKV